MASTIVTKNSSTASAVPVSGDLTQGELAVNVTDKRLFTKNSGGTVVELGTNPASLALPNGTANGVAYLNGSKVVTTGSALTFDGTNLNVGSATFPSGRIRLKQADDTTKQKGLIIEAAADDSLLAIGYDGSAFTFNPTYNTTGGYKPMAWWVSGSEAMRLTSTGLGIGTSSPAQTLHVKTSTAATPITLGVLSNATTLPALSFNGAYASTTMAGTYSLTGSLYTTVPSGAAQYFSIADSIKLTLDSSGNLGLGVTPSAWASMTALQVKQAALVGYFNQNKLMANSYFNGSAYTYIASDYASELRQDSGKFMFFTAPSGTAGNAITFTQAMTLDASGRLVIGGTTAISDAGITIANDSSGGATVKLSFSTTTTERGSISMSGGGGELKLTSGYSGYGGFTTFYTNGSERARIDISGNLLVGTTNSDNTVNTGSRLYSNGSFGTTRSGTDNTTSTLVVYSTGASTNRFYVGMAGTVYATSTTITAISDQRLKENIQDIDVGLDAVMALKPRKFDWKAGKGKNKKGDRGWIAQEFEQVFPDMIDTWADPAPEGEEPYKAVNADLIPVLVKAIQDQQALIQQLQADVAALKGN